MGSEEKVGLGVGLVLMVVGPGVARFVGDRVGTLVGSSSVITGAGVSTGKRRMVGDKVVSTAVGLLLVCLSLTVGVSE